MGPRDSLKVLLTPPKVLLPSMTVLLASLLVLGTSLTLPAQRAEPITAARVRALAKEAEADGRGDKTEIVLALDRKFRQHWGDFESFPVSIVKREDLTVVLSTPFMTYRRALAEHLRMESPIATIPWTPTVVVTVGPIQIGAPDIKAVLVTRNGKRVGAVETRLKAMSFANGNGQTAVIHAGDVHFPLSAFAAGAQVTVAAVPSAGEPFVYTFESNQLRTLK